MRQRCLLDGDLRLGSTSFSLIPLFYGFALSMAIGAWPFFGEMRRAHSLSDFLLAFRKEHRRLLVRLPLSSEETKKRKTRVCPCFASRYIRLSSPRTRFALFFAGSFLGDIHETCSLCPFFLRGVGQRPFGVVCPIDASLRGRDAGASAGGARTA